MSLGATDPKIDVVVRLFQFSQVSHSNKTCTSTYLSISLYLSIYLSFFHGKKISQTPFSRVHVEFKGCQSRCHALKALHLGNQQPGGSKWRRRGKLQVLFLLSLSRGSWVLGSWVVISTLGLTRYLSMENLSATTKSNTHHFICPKECDFGAYPIVEHTQVIQSWDPTSKTRIWNQPFWK